MDFVKIIKEHGAAVRQVIKSVTNENNEDLEQEVYLRVYKNSEKYTPTGSFKSWICTIARNISKDYLKSAAFRHEKPADDEDDNKIISIKDKKPTPENIFLIKQRQKRISEAINGLKPKFKEVIILAEIEGLSYEAIAQKLNVPLGTVKSRIYNAKKELAEVLSDLM